MRTAATVLASGHVLGIMIHTLPDSERKILHAALDGPVDRRSQLHPVTGQFVQMLSKLLTANVSRTQGNIQPRIVPAVLAPALWQGIPDFPICGQSGPRFPFPAESGNGDFPIMSDSRFRPSRKSGIPSPFPGPGQIGNRGNGNWGFPGLFLTRSDVWVDIVRKA